MRFDRINTRLWVKGLLGGKFLLLTFRKTLFLQRFGPVQVDWQQIGKPLDKPGRGIHKNICRKVDCSQLSRLHLACLLLFGGLLVQRALELLIASCWGRLEDDAAEMDSRLLLVIGLD